MKPPMGAIRGSVSLTETLWPAEWRRRGSNHQPSGNSFYPLSLYVQVLCLCHLTLVTPVVSVEYKRYNGTNQKSQAHGNNDDHCGTCQQQTRIYTSAADWTGCFTICLSQSGPKHLVGYILIHFQFILCIKIPPPSYPSQVRLIFCL